MRAHLLAEHVTTAIKDAFEPDVAEAITTDEPMFNALVRRLSRDYDTPQAITRAIIQIADSLDDGTADWLVESANSPAGWFISRL